MSKLDKSDIAKRMKTYEYVERKFLTKRIPVIIRADGRAFHTVAKKVIGKKKGYSVEFSSIMQEVAAYAQSQMQGCSIAYSQSDEITFLLTDYKTIHTNAWFDYNKSKLETITAAACAAKFVQLTGILAEFDARAFNMPQDDVTNNFIWRQMDATRNAISMAGQANFPHKELQGLSSSQLQEKLFQEKGINFDKYPITQKRGFCIINGEVDLNIPIFSKKREYIDKFVYVRED